MGVGVSTSGQIADASGDVSGKRGKIEGMELVS